jgi:hypothetical protein
MPSTSTSPLVPLPTREPARFEPWPPDVQERAFALWSSIGARNAARTALLLVRELGEDTPVPAASTIRRWAHDLAWGARADADLERSHGRTLYALQVGWLAALQLAQQTLLDGMAGALDDAPGGGLARIKSAEITLRVIERAGLLAILPTPPEPDRPDDDEGKTREQKEAEAMAAITRGTRGRRP